METDARSQKNTRPVSVIVLTWNGLEDTKKCLASLIKNTPDDVELIVCDNGSTDGTVEYAESLPRVIVVRNGENLGFVRGNNAAMQLVDADRDIVLLNSDTYIEDGRWIEKLAGTAYRSDDVGVVGCRIKRIDGNMLQHAGTYMPDFTYWGQQYGSGEQDVNQYNRDREVEGVVFACVYIRREVIEKIGLLDEEFFSYFEDTDYCLKAREAGFRVFNCGALTIGHLEHGSTKANKVNFNEMFLTSQKTFVKKWESTLQARHQGHVNLHSTFMRPVGYAMTARQIAMGLEDAGVDVSYEYLYGEGTVFPVAEDRNTSSGVYQIEVIKRRKPVHGAPTLIYGQADAFDSVASTSPRIGYTMLETTGIPREWVEQSNNLDELWVPSAFNKWTFTRCGVNVPMKVIPLGLIDIDHFNPGIKGHPLPGTYTFLSIFEWGERKAPEKLLRAFNRAFRASEPVVLICRFSNHDPGVDPLAIIDSLGLDPAGGRIIYSINEPVPYYQVAQIYRSADCFVLTTRGEGWGMPIMEAMACGLPVIATYWSAQQAFLNDRNSYPLQASLIDAEAKCPYYQGFKWADPDERHLEALLRHVYENRDEAAEKGRQAARDVAELWSLEASAVRMKKALAMHSSAIAPVAISAPALSPRIAIDVSRSVGPQSSGVGRFASELVNGLSQSESAGFEYILLPGFGDFVHPQYSPCERSAFRYDTSPQCTLYRGPLPAFKDDDHVVPGLALLYCTANNFVKAPEGASVMVVHDTTFLSHPEFHTKENIDFCSRAFAKAVDADAWFVANSAHTKMDFLQRYGVSEDRVHVIHCGIDTRHFKPASGIELASVRQRYDLPAKFTLFVGSLEPRKNLETLLKAMRHLPNSHVLVIAGASGWKNSELHSLLSKLGDQVKLLGYVRDDDLPALYSAASAFVYPSIYEGFGLPVIEAMACGTPVITTNGSSMKEIAEGAAILVDDPADEREISRQLSRLFEDQEIAADLTRLGLERSKQYTSQQFAAKHVEFFRSIIGA